MDVQLRKQTKHFFGPAHTGLSSIHFLKILLLLFKFFNQVPGV